MTTGVSDTACRSDPAEQRLMLVSWDCTGAEAVIDCTAKQHQMLLQAVQQGTYDYDQWLSHTVTTLRLRARFNSQRRYEIYAVWVAADITEQLLWQLLDQDPQPVVDLIRAQGTCLWSDRAEQSQPRIR